MVGVFPAYRLSHMRCTVSAKCWRSCRTSVNSSAALTVIFGHDVVLLSRLKSISHVCDLCDNNDRCHSDYALKLYTRFPGHRI